MSKPLTLTRRDLASGILLAVPAAAQTATEPANDLDENARAQIRRNTELLKKIELPASAEPSFAFKP